jgi:hypothetical protein
MITVPGDAPYDRAALRVFYPANETESAKETGVFPIRPLKHQPVVIFFPGVNCSPHSNYWLLRYLAENNLVVAILEWVGQNLPGRSSYTPGIDISALAPNVYGTKPTASALLAILDELKALNESEVFSGILNLNCIALGGHSAGGMIALQNANQEWFPGVQAAFAVCANPLPTMALGGWKDGKLPPLPDSNVLLIGGTHDVIGNLHNQQFGRPLEHGWETVQAVFDQCYSETEGNRKYLAILKGVNHHTICDPLDETIGRTYLEPTVGDQAAVRKHMARWIRSFLMLMLWESNGWAGQLQDMVTEPDMEFDYIVRRKWIQAALPIQQSYLGV